VLCDQVRAMDIAARNAVYVEYASDEIRAIA